MFKADKNGNLEKVSPEEEERVQRCLVDVGSRLFPSEDYQSQLLTSKDDKETEETAV